MKILGKDCGCARRKAWLKRQWDLLMIWFGA